MRPLVIPMETRVTDQAAFILRRRDWHNTSLILDLFTRDFGCLSVIAKGARRNPAKIAYQPFALLNLGWIGRGELKTLTAIEGQPLPVLEQNYIALLYVNELIAALMPPRESNPEAFMAYFALLQAAADELGEAGLRRFELEFMRLLGYFPDLGRDAQGGSEIRPQAYYQFIINSGFVECAAAAADSVKGQVIIDWIAQRYQQDDVLCLAKAVLRSTIDFNLHGKTLKSREVYQQMMQRQ